MDEGEIVAVGTPTEVFDNSTNERVLEFLSKIL
jgi:ABC-type polar amino acid transport system ATPase subunit